MARRKTMYCAPKISDDESTDPNIVVPSTQFSSLPNGSLRSKTHRINVPVLHTERPVEALVDAREAEFEVSDAADSYLDPAYTDYAAEVHVDRDSNPKRRRVSCLSTLSMLICSYLILC